MASITIRITEDDDPNGHVDITHDIEGFDLDGARDNDLPASLLLGAKMLELTQELPDTGPADIATLRLFHQTD